MPPVLSLEQLGSILPILMAMIQDDPIESRAAVELVGEIQDPRILPALIDALPRHRSEMLARAYIMRAIDQIQRRIRPRSSIHPDTQPSGESPAALDGTLEWYRTHKDRLKWNDQEKAYSLDIT
jgi:hypothetical protein